MPQGHIAVKPVRAGMNLSHPSGGRALPDTGGFWPSDAFTYRRIREGGVVEYDPEAEAKAAREAKSAAEDRPEPQHVIGDKDPPASRQNFSGASMASPAQLGNNPPAVK